MKLKCLFRPFRTHIITAIDMHFSSLRQKSEFREIIPYSKGEILTNSTHPSSYYVTWFHVVFSAASTISIKIDGVKDFTYEEMKLATNNFNVSTQVGQGGYGKVYKGILADGTVVAIKRAQEGSLQGEKEFLTEIELLSRVHHRNLVSLIGYCDDEGEQVHP
ncbi:unnamed protein product [Ilex paraguariensis]|uniref:Protein kinase domain-containing protein n=1 Tax=Ilex paraguariensis TaxID=185542 RepID=A0ABC8QQ89_9AQUA